MKVTYRTKRGIAGFLFVLPWLIGLLIFFVQPVILLLRLAFTDMAFAETAGFVLKPLEGLWDNFKSVLSIDPYFPSYLISSIGGLKRICVDE